MAVTKAEECDRERSRGSASLSVANWNAVPGVRSGMIGMASLTEVYFRLSGKQTLLMEVEMKRENETFSQR